MAVKSRLRVQHSGVGDWHIKDVKYRQVRELMDMARESEEYVAKHQNKPPKDFHDRVHEMRWERIRWLFANCVCDERGELFPDMNSVEAFEDLGWVELRELEDAASSFLFAGGIAPAS